MIISVYNNLHFLQLVLAGFELQTEKAFELIISDDGSGEEFVAGLNKVIGRSRLDIRHNWHEDAGFRKNKILNSSVQKSAAPYLIFVDGDCIPHPRFVEEHLKAAATHLCLVGRRVDLSNRLTKKLTTVAIRSGYLSSGWMAAEMVLDYAMGKLAHIKSGIYVRNRLLREILNRKERGLLGANFSIHKDDLLAINGFDERYIQPTFGEDSDVELRLRLNKVFFKPLVSIAVCYHCHHKLLPRPAESKLLYEKAVLENRAFTPYGIIKG